MYCTNVLLIIFKPNYALQTKPIDTFCLACFLYFNAYTFFVKQI